MTYLPGGEDTTSSNSNSVNAAGSSQGSLAINVNTTTETTITVGSGEGLNYVPTQYIKINSEILSITSISGDVLTVTRGVLDSTAATHSASDPVTGIKIAGNTTLAETITTETQFNLASTSEIETGCTIKIGSEFMIVTAISSPQVTVRRAQYDSTEDGHTNGDTVTGVFIGVRDQNTQPWVQTSLTTTVSGTLFYDFSNNSTVYSTYPVTGFTVDSGVHEFHQAIKGKRYFRVRFENGGSSSSTNFNVYTYFGIFNNGMLPINQNIGIDQDSMVTRAVGVGRNPEDDFINVRTDGNLFTTTSDIAGTLLVTTLSDSYTGDVEVEDVTGFGTSGSMLIGTEFINYDGVSTGTNTLTVPSGGRAQFMSSASSHSSGVSVGYVYNSGIKNTDGYTQVITKLVSDNTMKPVFIWYSDSEGVSVVRQISPQYPAPSQTTGDYSFLSAPIFSPYTRYLLANQEGVSATNVYYSSDLTTKSISGQILTIEDEVLPQMTANLQKAITVGRQPDGDYINTPATGLAFETDTPLGYTIIHGSLDSSQTGNFTVDSTSSFSDSGYLNISDNNTVDEIVEYSIVDGTTINIPSGGRAQIGTSASSHGPSPNAMGVYSSAIAQGKWNDTDGFEIIEIDFVSDALSAINGLIVRFTNDANVAEPETRISKRYTYTTQNVIERGNQSIRLSAAMDGYSLIYVNGISVQSDFYLGSTHRVAGSSNLYSDAGSLIVADYSTEVSLGNISNRANVTKFGRCGDIDTGTDPADLWGQVISGTPAQTSLYTGQTATGSETVSVVSSSTSDTSAGTGARTIVLSGLLRSDSSQYTTETVTLNGTTPVTTVNSWYRINRAFVQTVGSGGFNAGTITFNQSTTTSVVFGVIPIVNSIGLNQSQIAAFTIPAGVFGIIKRVYMTVAVENNTGAGIARIGLMVRDTLTTNSGYKTLAFYDAASGSIIDDQKNGGIIINPGSDVLLRVFEVTSPNTTVNGEMEFELVTLID